jgi:hypothetical protein
VSRTNTSEAVNVYVRGYWKASKNEDVEQGKRRMAKA